MSAPSPEPPESDKGEGRESKAVLFSHWRKLSVLARLAALPVYFYRLVLSPLLPRSCRFEPSCSVYALDALARHGVFRGGWLTLKRMCRCHPFECLGAGSGYDPVPGTDEARRWEERQRQAAEAQAGRIGAEEEGNATNGER